MATKSLIFILSQMRHLKKCIEDKLSSLLPILNFIPSRFCKKKKKGPRILKKLIFTDYAVKATQKETEKIKEKTSAQIHITRGFRR